jgi:hypothetical protein
MVRGAAEIVVLIAVVMV